MTKRRAREAFESGWCQVCIRHRPEPQRRKWRIAIKPGPRGARPLSFCWPHYDEYRTAREQAKAAV